jgi:hypothetical protein
VNDEPATTSNSSTSTAETRRDSAGRMSDWARRTPGAAVAVVGAVALLIGTAVGFGIGYKVEQSRTRADVTRLKQNVASLTPTTTTATGAFARRAGRVTAVTSNSLTVTLADGKHLTITTTSAAVDQATKGTRSDLAAGRRLLATPKVREILVLPIGSKVGLPVTAVANGVVTVTSPKGRNTKLKTTNDTVVDVASRGTGSDLAVGANIVAFGQGTPFDAVEIIIVPGGSAFAVGK